MMSNAINTYKEIISDFANPENAQVSHLNRSILLSNKIRLLYVVMAIRHQRILAVMLPNDYDKVAVERFPKWQGISTKVGNISAYENDNDEHNYVIISQAQENDSGIFEIVANDIVSQLEKVSNPSGVVRCLSATLQKWKKFFEINHEVIMSEQSQQGLYGELLLLKRFIPIWGDETVKFWCGAEKETHDFYINGNAIEVKTTSAKSNEKIKINSEQQMDCADVDNNLFLYVNMVRKSIADGEKLPNIVDDIINMLDSEETQDLFLEKLFDYGYIPSCPEKYIVGFFLRAKKCYSVIDGFPCITSKSIPMGISDVSYSIDLNVCNDYQIEWNELLRKIKEA